MMIQELASYAQKLKKEEQFELIIEDSQIESQQDSSVDIAFAN